MDYALTKLGDREFEHLSQALTLSVLGPGVQVFGDGPDGGREAAWSGRVVMIGAAAGAHRIDDRGAIALPAAARRMCGIPTGSPVVLVAIVHRQVLIAHPASTVAQVLAAHHTGLISTGDAR